MIPTLRVGEFGQARCFLLLFVLTGTVLENERVSRPYGRGPKSISHGSNGQQRQTAGGSRNHGSNDNAISCKVTKGLEPTRAVVGEGIPLEEGSVECVCIVNKLSKIFKSDLGSEGRTSQVLEETIKAICLKMNDDVLLLRNIVQCLVPARSPKG